jgi:methionine-rich copper-binding protein CopC
MKTISKTVLLLICISVMVSTALASWQLTSDPIQVEVIASNPSSLDLQSSHSTVTQGEQITLTASLNKAVAGATVIFHQNNAQIGQATTNANGVATFQVTLNNVGTQTFFATATP